jgi:hypothetical protein
MEPSILPGRTGLNCKDFTEDEQAVILARGRDNLVAAGAENVCAFRAGNFGANFDTLRALKRIGMKYDTSHNTCWLKTHCGMDTGDLLTQPRWIEGVYELPVTFFEDWPGHGRNTMVCAVSSAEMRNALLRAWREGWSSFVIVSHGFELLKLKERKQTLRPQMPDRVVVKRFEQLCAFLGANKDKFRTALFKDITPSDVPQPAAPLRSKVRHTVLRYAEQAVRRVVPA